MNDEQEQKPTVELESLCGEHLLTGVDRSNQSYKDWAGRDEFQEVLNFTLDGTTYTAVEDPEDGYRSCMESFRVSDKPTSNTFPPCKVIGRMKAPGQWEDGCHVLELVDAVTGKVVLQVGTTNTRDWYPSFVAHFSPENMAVNIGR